jgi:hypothetical protein
MVDRLVGNAGKILGLAKLVLGAPLVSLVERGLTTVVA